MFRKSASRAQGGTRDKVIQSVQRYRNLTRDKKHGTGHLSPLTEKNPFPRGFHLFVLSNAATWLPPVLEPVRFSTSM